MIQYIKRKDLDVAKYDACIENAAQSRIYAYSWYLDIVADNWDVLVLDDYKAVMPIPWRKKILIKYAYTPLRILELGFFSEIKINENVFIDKLFEHFKYINLRMNCKNFFSTDHRKIKQQQFLNINLDYKEIQGNYRSDRKKDLKKAKKNGLTEKWNDNPEILISLFKSNVGKRFKKMQDKDYLIMRELIDACIHKKMGEILSIYDSENLLVASGFFIKHKHTVVILFSSTNLQNRKNGANTFLIDRSIFKYKNSCKIYGFGGSSIESIANFFKSFGAYTEEYSDITYNNLPKFLKLLKK